MSSPAVDDEIWAKILHDVQSRSSSTLPNGSVIVLGDSDSGKTSLVARLHGIDDPKKGFGLEYHTLDINPDYRNGSYAYQLSSALPDISPGESLRLGVWVLDGNVFYSPLMKFALTTDMLKHSVVLICCSMAEPWSLMETLRCWTNTLENHLKSTDIYDSHLLSESQEQLVRFWQEYVEPLDSSSHSDLGAKVPSMETEQFLLPLGETVLTHNIGIPIIVVMTKCDTIPSLERDFDLRNKQFDFIQTHVRRFCLTIGAALIYTNAKEGRNCDVLYKYILHRVYGFPFTQPASILERDAIFIPAGWDTVNKIKVVEETWMSSSDGDDNDDDAFEARIKKPAVRRATPKEADLYVDDEHTFLSKVQVVLNSQLPNNSPAVHRSQPEAVMVKSLAQASQPEGALAQFFNNLLIKKAASTASSPTQPARAVSPAKFSADHEVLKEQLREKSREEMSESDNNDGN